MNTSVLHAFSIHGLGVDLGRYLQRLFGLYRHETGSRVHVRRRVWLWHGGGGMNRLKRVWWEYRWCRSEPRLPWRATLRYLWYVLVD